MIIKKAEFVKSFAKTEGLDKLNKPQFAFVGRSNVGKSSLLNALCNRKNLAKTSSTPGRTRLINTFLINDAFYFVDLPGYGYAKASKTEQIGWKSLIGGYLENSENLKLVFVLVDSRHEPTDKDMQSSDQILQEVNTKAMKCVQRLSTIYSLDSVIQKYQMMEEAQNVVIDAAQQEEEK